MQSIQIRLCLVAKDLLQMHGVYYTACFLADNNIDIQVALNMLVRGQPASVADGGSNYGEHGSAIAICQRKDVGPFFKIWGTTCVNGHLGRYATHTLR